jgi:hypothetical protein
MDIEISRRGTNDLHMIPFISYFYGLVSDIVYRRLRQDPLWVG